MLYTSHAPKHFTPLLALTLALVGLTGGPTLPRAAAGQPAPQDGTAHAHAAQLAGPPTAVSRLTPPEETTQARVRAAYGKLPLSFEANHGQTAPQVQFLARGRGYSLFLTAQEAALAFSHPAGHHTAPGAVMAHRAVEAQSATPPPAVVRMTLVGANAAPPVIGHDALPGKSNYLIGNDPQQWRTDIPHYAKVRYERVYPGVDLLYYGNQGQLEYDFIVSPGADPRAITLAFAGASDVRLSADGALVLSVGGGEIRQRKPVIYQEVDGVRQEIAGGYRLAGHHVSFAVGEYDMSRPLVIDPVLVYATYLGGSGEDRGFGIAVDKDGQAYVTGVTGSFNFPTTPGAFQPVFAEGRYDAFVTKVNRRGTALDYSTYLGGSGFDVGSGIAVDKQGHAFVTGVAISSNFPTTRRAFQPVFAGGSSDAFVTKLNRSGTALVYSTYLGGSVGGVGSGIGGEEGQDIAVDEDGRAYVTGQTLSTDFPTTAGAFQPANAGSVDAFVTKLNRSGTALVYSTYLGGSGGDYGFGIAVDEDGRAYVTGQTSSPNLPTTAGAFQPANAGGVFDAFVATIGGDDDDGDEDDDDHDDHD